MLDYMSRLDESQQEIRELKLALVTAHILLPFDAFPELRPEDDTDEDDEPKEGEEVTYVFPNAPEDQQSIEDELRGMLAIASAGTAKFSGSEDDWL